MYILADWGESDSAAQDGTAMEDKSKAAVDGKRQEGVAKAKAPDSTKHKSLGESAGVPKRAAIAERSERAARKSTKVSKRTTKSATASAIKGAPGAGAPQPGAQAEDDATEQVPQSSSGDLKSKEAAGNKATAAKRTKSGTAKLQPGVATTKKKTKKSRAVGGTQADELTLEEQLEAELSSAEIENFQIEKVDMERLTNKVCNIILSSKPDGMLQNALWKRLKISNRNGARLALRMERRGILTREKILEQGRWTYKLILKKTPISTESIEDAPCLNCPVEQRCSSDGEISPRTCTLIEDWVMADLRRTKKSR